MLFKKITHAEGAALIKRGHYSHKSGATTWTWGIVEGEEIVGVLTVGKPQSQTPLIAICGIERAKDVLELTRLWVDDRMPRNTESQFIGWVLREIRRNHKGTILVSYADCAWRDAIQGTTGAHCGYVYQATNWLYTGCTGTMAEDITYPAGTVIYSVKPDDPQPNEGWPEVFDDSQTAFTPTLKFTMKPTHDYRSTPRWTRGGKVKNKREWARKETRLGSLAIKIPHTVKHRYVWFSDPNDRKLLKYAVLPYPKRA